jgi:hypothetical protein
MMDPIEVEFEVACSAEHAFEMWAGRTSLWWPRSHTITGQHDVQIHFEPRPGGRIFERANDGTEHEWGEIVVWEPPHKIGYLWHLFFTRAEATDIEVTFTPTEGGTNVRLVQTGFERLPSDVAMTRRNRTEGAWGEVTGHFREAIASDS